MISKKQCKNDTTLTYTGKESSPLGLGFSASAEAVGSRMMGRDETMWMVGIKNGVKVWNRVPTEIAAAAAPLTKEAPVLGDNVADVKKETEVEVKPKAVAKRVVKKKVEEKKPKKVDTDEESASDEDKKPMKKVDADEEPPVAKAEPVEEEKPKPKKKVVKKKVEVEEDAKSEVSKEDAPKKKPTSFNIFMSYRVKELGKEEPGLAHKEKFGKAAAEWRGMDDAAKKAFLAKVAESK